MAWDLQGMFYENCSCDAICPCTWSNLAHRATRDDYCRFALAFLVESGEIEGVDVSGRQFVLIGDTPPNMADGNWRLGVFVDDGASSEQVDKLGQVLSGALGGPPRYWGRCWASSSGSSRHRSPSTRTVAGTTSPWATRSTTRARPSGSREESR
jgi:hypothetical protein